MGFYITLTFLVVELAWGISARADIVRDKVNLNLRKMQTTIESRDTAARIQGYQLKGESQETQEYLLQNSPGYGLGNEAGSVAPMLRPDELAYDSAPSSPTAEQQIRQEVEALRGTKAPASQNENYQDQNKNSLSERWVK
jgi:hypothetical protein